MFKNNVKNARMHTAAATAAAAAASTSELATRLPGFAAAL